MKTKRNFFSGMEVLDSVQLNQVRGGETIFYIIVNGYLVPISIPEKLKKANS